MERNKENFKMQHAMKAFCSDINVIIIDRLKNTQIQAMNIP